MREVNFITLNYLKFNLNIFLDAKIIGVQLVTAVAMGLMSILLMFGINKVS